jgi:hypothetical protein
VTETNPESSISIATPLQASIILFIMLPFGPTTSPILAGFIGAVGGYLSGMSYGGTALLAVLAGSASYIAAPAAVSIALPKEKLGLALTCSIGITFPFNLILGIPIYLAMANFLVN